MRTPSKRSTVRRRVCAIGAVGLAAGVIALAQDPAPGRAPIAPRGGMRFVRVGPAYTSLVPQAFDACLVQAPEVDPQFVLPARECDAAILVPARVAGLYRGTLERRP